MKLSMGSLLIPVEKNCVLQHYEIEIIGTVFSLFIDQFLFLRVQPFLVDC